MPSDTFAAGIEAAARVAESIERAASNEVHNYDSYGGPSLPGREREAIKEDAARDIAVAIRNLTPTASEATAIGAGEAHVIETAQRLAARMGCVFVPNCSEIPNSSVAASPKVASDTAISPALTVALESIARDRGAFVTIYPAEAKAILAALAASPTASDTDTPVDPGVEGVREALTNLLQYADPSGDGIYDGASDIVGVKANGKIVLKGSFITLCIRAERALAALAAKPIAGMDAGEVEDA